MKAVIKEFGAPSVLVTEPLQLPKIEKNQVLIKIYAAGVNPVETYKRAGSYGQLNPPLPWTPGHDGAGVVEEIGDDVRSVQVGNRVWTSSSVTGTYAQYAISNQENVHLLSNSLSFEQGAALWTPYGTAYHALYQVGQVDSLKTPSFILVHGASGGVGTACVQLAKMIPEATVIGTAGTQEGCERILKLGADFAFNHKEENYMEKILEKTQGKGVNIILEMLANVNLGKDLKILAFKGKVVIIGSRGNVEITPRDLMLKRSEIRAVHLGQVTVDEFSGIIKGIQEGTNKGNLLPVIGKTYDLSSSAQSHIDIMDSSKSSPGKLVILPWKEKEEYS